MAGAGTGGRAGAGNTSALNGPGPRQNFNLEVLLFLSFGGDPAFFLRFRPRLRLEYGCAAVDCYSRLIDSRRIVTILRDDVFVPKFSVRTSPYDAAVPSGRMGYNFAADRLLLHTIQTPEAFEELLSTDRLVPDTSLADPHFGDAYDWMLRQMTSRLSSTGDGALWFWARILRRDLVDLCKAAPGSVLLTCRVPRERVLVSHFGDWHAALNGSPHVPDLLGESDDDHVPRIKSIFDEFEVRQKAAGAPRRPVRNWPSDLRADLERTWEHLLEPANFGRSDTMQATMHVLHAEDVVEAVRLEG